MKWGWCSNGINNELWFYYFYFLSCMYNTMITELVFFAAFLDGHPKFLKSRY